ncbi:MAG: AmpG family muropeptide MFS transporter [Deltaproteobacteria bacterium]|nr:AmpG family muropeptide MFS transporter [Deltaproteobacteria bacterium]
MTAEKKTPDLQPLPKSSPSLLGILLSRRMAVAALMGFSAGLPLLLTSTLLQAWMKEEKVNLEIIGLTALIGLPYTLKFLWSPIMDRYTPPFLGRRRGWLLISQILLMISIVGLGLSDPRYCPWFTAIAAILVAFFSASQDIVIDAYRREDLADEELGLGSSFYVNGYRVGMLLASGGGLIMADKFSFPIVYFFMAASLALGFITTLITPEPQVEQGAPRSLKEAVFEPFIDYFTRPGALWILVFILFYKLGDQMASAMTTPFYLELGFTKTEIGAVVKLFGFWALVIGGFVGGALMVRLGIKRSLWLFGILQALTILSFSVLAKIGPSTPALAAAIGLENFAGGMGTSAYVAFMASLTNKKFTATQYALLSSLMGVPRVLLSAPTGYLATLTGWPMYFIVCTLMAIPGLLLLLKFAPLNKNED